MAYVCIVSISVVGVPLCLSSCLPVGCFLFVCLVLLENVVSLSVCGS